MPTWLRNCLPGHEVDKLVKVITMPLGTGEIVTEISTGGESNPRAAQVGAISESTSFPIGPLQPYFNNLDFTLWTIIQRRLHSIPSSASTLSYSQFSFQALRRFVGSQVVPLKLLILVSRKHVLDTSRFRFLTSLRLR